MVLNYGFCVHGSGSMPSVACSKHKRFIEVWFWIVALDAFDHDHAAPLGDLLRGDEPIPTELRPALADIVTGVRKPNKKAAAKMKVQASERMAIAGSVSIILGLVDLLKHGTDDEGQRFVEVGADRRGREPIDEVRDLESTARFAIEDAAHQLGVSIETVENLVRDLRRKMEQFPVV